MINWHYFPESDRLPVLGSQVVEAFAKVAGQIESGQALLNSNGVLAVLRQPLLELGFQVELGKKDGEKIHVPVLFGRNGVIEKSFHADAYHPSGRFVVEVEAGRAVVNNQFLKDLFQACMMQDVDYLAIAVCNHYGSLPDFSRVERFFETLYASRRLVLPLKGILVIGY